MLTLSCFQIIAVRYNDIRDGTNLAEQVTKKYRDAWDAKGMVQADGLYADWLMLKQDVLWPPENVPFGGMPARDIGFTAWSV